jgi:DNA polymerase-3 subunit epsilon
VNGEFWALDVETANADRSTICQIGAVHFVDGMVKDRYTQLIDPEDEFDPMNVAIHGIGEEAVRGAPRFADVFLDLRSRLGAAAVATHTSFDRGAVHRACVKAGLAPPAWRWLDSAACARRTWPDVAWRGYGLAPLAARLGIVFKHHDAVEDARACGEVLLAASREAALDVDGWIARCRQPVDLTASSSDRIALTGDLQGPLAGHVVVFTGALRIPRAQAAKLASELGCDVAPGVNKKTTMLVCGDQDARRLNGDTKSNKLEKAEKLAHAGQPIEFLTESDFEMLSTLPR